MTHEPEFYEVWDDSTGNRLGEFSRLADAQALLAQLMREHGPDAVRTLAILSYTPQHGGIDEFRVETVIEGSDVAREKPAAIS